MGYTFYISLLHMEGKQTTDVQMEVMCDVSDTTESEASSDRPQGGETCCFGLKKCGAPPKAGLCGFEVEERPDFSVWEKEDKACLLVPLFFATLAALCTLVWWSGGTEGGLQWMQPPDMTEYLTQMFVVTLAILLFWYPLGLAVWYGGVSVALTRKVTHTVLLTLIPLSAVASSHGQGLLRDVYLAMVWQSLSTTLLVSLIFLKPARQRVPLFRIAFASVERTEDRPFALLWVLMQSTAMTMVQTPMIQWMLSSEKGLLIWIPFLSVALGDGLAEPIGKRFGKHKYKARALCTSKSFTRSYEGSACVFVWTLIAVAIATPQMSGLQMALCFLLVPLANTLMEAVSPHTWDNHLMWGITWLLLWLIFDVLPAQI